MHHLPITGYEARNGAMLLYPLYALFVFRHYRSHDLTVWIASFLCLYLLFTIPFREYTHKLFIITKAVSIYHEKKHMEQGIVYVPKIIVPKAYNSTEPSMGGGDKASNMVFRILIWQDMVHEIVQSRAWFGMGLSHPLRSPQLERLGWAKEQWGREGWISAHNGYLYIVYRTGIFGIVLIFFLFRWLWLAYRQFRRSGDTVGYLLLVPVCYWLVQASFMEIFTLPYYSIPLWVVTGLVFNRYALNRRTRQPAIKTAV